MTLPDIEAVLKKLTPEEVLDTCDMGIDSETLVEALADYIEENQEMILENLEANGVI